MSNDAVCRKFRCYVAGDGGPKSLRNQLEVLDGAVQYRFGGRQKTLWRPRAVSCSAPTLCRLSDYLGQQIRAAKQREWPQPFALVAGDRQSFPLSSACRLQRTHDRNTSLSGQARHWRSQRRLSGVQAGRHEEGQATGLRAAAQRPALLLANGAGVVGRPADPPPGRRRRRRCPAPASQQVIFQRRSTRAGEQWQLAEGLWQSCCC
jgi:hypothetical protein